MTFVVLSRAGQIPRTFLLSHRHEFFMNVCVCKCVCVGGPSDASIAISAAAGVIVPQWLQCRRKKNTLSDNTAEGNKEEKMEQRHMERERQSRAEG